jgi:hypothetical protein
MQLATTIRADIDADAPAGPHTRGTLGLADGVVGPRQRPRLTTAPPLPQGRTLGRVVYRVKTCALIASGIKG